MVRDCKKKIGKSQITKRYDDYLEYLKVKLLKVKNLCAKNAKIENLEVTNIETDTATIDTVNSNNINLNGQDLNCLLTRPAVIALVNPFIYPPLDVCENPSSIQDAKPPTVDQRVWDALLENACTELNGPPGHIEPIPSCLEWAIVEASITGFNLTISGFYFGNPTNIIPGVSTISGTGVLADTTIVSGSGLNWVVDKSQNVSSTRLCFKAEFPLANDVLRARLQCGREFINQFLACKNCPRACPACPEGDVTTPCRVPMILYSLKTYPLFTTIPSCGPTGSAPDPRFVLSVSYTLNVDYQLEFAESTDARVVSVLCQLCYIDGTGEAIVTVIDIGNKQFYPTLDVCHGEKYTGQINIPSDLVLTAYRAMPNPNNTAAVQLVIYSENGVQVNIGNACVNTSTKQVEVIGAPADELVVTMPTGTFLSISAITPNQGAAGITVTINLIGSQDEFTISNVLFGSTPATSFNVEGFGCSINCVITAVVPAGTGTVPVSVISNFGPATGSASFTYV